MIVRSISVTNWRCFLDEMAMGPFDEGLNVIYAPNGTGKSTLFEAFRRVLLDSHRVSGREVEALRPWGRDLAPRVVVEFIHGGEEYRISKRFLDSPSALFERKERGKYRPLAEGASADEKARDILSRNPPSRGLSRLENFGIAQVLWVPQGNLAVGPLSGDVVADIRNVLSVQVSGAGSSTIEKKIEERYLEYFSTKGKIKSGKDAPRIVRIRDEFEEAQLARNKARELYLAFEGASRQVEELRSRCLQAGRDSESLRSSLRRARVVADAYRNLTTERKQKAEQTKTAEAQYSETNRHLEDLKSSEADLRETLAAASRLGEELSVKEGEVLEREKEAAICKAGLENVRRGRDAIEAAERMAESARHFRECSRDSDRLSDLIAKIRGADRRLAELRQKREALVAPDAKLLRAIRNTIKERDEAQLRIEASLITLEIVPRQDGSVEVVAGEKPGQVQMKAGIPTQIQGAPEVVAEFSTVARLRAWGPAGSIEEHREARTKAERKLGEMTRSYGTAEPEALETLLEKSNELDRSMSKAETELRTLLANQTVEELVQEHAACEAARANYLKAYPGWEASTLDVQSLEDTAEELKQGLKTRTDLAEAAWTKAYAALTSAASQKDTLCGRLEDMQRHVADLRTRIAGLTQDGIDVQGLERQRQTAALAWEASRARLDEIDEKLTQYDENPVALVESLEAQLEAAEGEAQSARDREIREETRLEGISSQGPYSALAVAEERLHELEQERRQEEIRIQAIRLLHDTVAECRSEAIAAVSAPVEISATRTLQRIAGRRLGRIQVGDSLEPAAVLPDSLNTVVTLDNLSGGEQEQLYLATRLALAEVLAKEERQLVVLDDVLTATDSGRLAKVMSILEEAAQGLQVLVLTCHPERYRGLREATFFDLESLLHPADSSWRSST